MSPEQLQFLMSQVSAEFTRKISSSSESGNLLTPDLVDQQLSSDEADADKPSAVRNLLLVPEADPQTDIGSADGQLPVTLAPALEAADEVDENEPGASEDEDDSGNDDRPSPRRRKEVVQEVDKAQAAASDHQRTVELQQETVADVWQQLEESQRANQLLRASNSAPTSALPPVSRSPNAEVNVATVYGSKWHCDPDTGRPFANKAFDMALCKGLGGRRCKTICHVVEWPMANAGSRDTPALDGSDSNNRREVQLKVGVIIDWVKDGLSRGDNIYRDTAPTGFQMGANPLVRIVIAGLEDEFAGLLP
ncbi:unnamed protein product [Closterium sp. NIES-64]|nr:unnamed protein product [Closterium sp. NIES-64]